MKIASKVGHTKIRCLSLAVALPLFTVGCNQQKRYSLGTCPTPTAISCGVWQDKWTTSYPLLGASSPTVVLNTTDAKVCQNISGSMTVASISTYSAGTPPSTIEFQTLLLCSLTNVGNCECEGLISLPKPQYIYPTMENYTFNLTCVDSNGLTSTYTNSGDC